MKMHPICCIAALLLAVGLAGCSEKKEEPAPSKAAPAPSNAVPAPDKAAAPGLSAAQIRAGKTASTSNLKQIGIAIMMYATDNNENLPPNFNALFKNNYLADSAVYISPADPVSRPKARGELRGENTSYVYVGKGLKDGVNPDLPVAFEKVEIVNATGSCCVLYADGHTGTVAMSAKKSNREIAEELVRKAGPGRENIKQLIVANAAAADAK